MRITINETEADALRSAHEYVNNLLERCDNDEDSDAIKTLRETLTGIEAIQRKITRPRRVNVRAGLRSLPNADVSRERSELARRTG